MTIQDGLNPHGAADDTWLAWTKHNGPALAGPEAGLQRLTSWLRRWRPAFP
jgi:hypothetical protein